MKRTLVTALLFFTGIASAIGFVDVTNNSSHSEAIDHIKARGIVEGYADGTYRPAVKINRYDFTKIIVGSRFSGAEIEDCQQEMYPFPDVPTNQWFTPYVCTAKKNGIVNGYIDGTFQGQRLISAPEAIKIVLEAYGQQIPPPLSPSEPWYIRYLVKAREIGLNNNIDSSAGSYLSRGEMAELIYHMDQMTNTGIPSAEPENGSSSQNPESEQPQDGKEQEPGRASAQDYKSVMTTVFWVGEPATDENAYISNAMSAWDDKWEQNFGGFDDPNDRCGYRPCDFIPNENPFYFALPYNDLDADTGQRKENAKLVPWFEETKHRKSILKNRWIEVVFNGRTCYAQWEDVGPHGEDDFDYVFGDDEHENTIDAGAGLDVSPAVWDCLGLTTNRVTKWRFVDRSDVPEGPWTEIETTSDVTW